MSLKKIALGLIIFLSFFLRFYKLGEVPPSLYWDEIINCYDSYCLLETGRDHHGRSWPITYLTSYGDFKNPLYTYFGIVPVKVFGLNEFSCRFPSAFFGFLTVVLIYFLAKELFIGRKKLGEGVGVLAAFFLAVSPWHLQFSRAGFEANVNLFLIVLGIFLFLRAVNKKRCYLLLSAVVFGLTPYSYHSSKMIMPILVLFLAIFYHKFIRKNLKWVLVSMAVGFLIVFPLMTKEARKSVFFRFSETNIFNEEDSVLISNKLRGREGWSFLANIIHNRRVFYTRKFLKHLTDHFDFDYLFLNGDRNLRHSTQVVGEFYLVEFFLLLAGVYFGLRKKEKVLLAPGAWLFISLIPASFTISTPHAIRTLSGLGSWQIIGGYGAYQWYKTIKSKGRRLLFLGFFGGSFLISIFYYLNYYYRHYPKEASRYWQYGYKRVVNYIKDNYDKYDKVILTNRYGRAYAYLLFYLEYPPLKIQEQMADLQKKGRGWGEINKFDKFEIGNVNWRMNRNQERWLLIGEAGEFPKKVKADEIVYDLERRPVFKIVSTGKSEKK